MDGTDMTEDLQVPWSQHSRCRLSTARSMHAADLVVQPIVVSSLRSWPTVASTLNGTPPPHRRHSAPLLAIQPSTVRQISSTTSLSLHLFASRTAPPTPAPWPLSSQRSTWNFRTLLPHPNTSAGVGVFRSLTNTPRTCPKSSWGSRHLYPRNCQVCPVVKTATTRFQ
jgi:hypothetical protein